MSAIEVNVFNEPSGNLIALVCAAVPGEGKRNCMQVNATVFTDRKPAVTITTARALSPEQLTASIELLQRFEQELKAVNEKHGYSG